MSLKQAKADAVAHLDAAESLIRSVLIFLKPLQPLADTPARRHHRASSLLGAWQEIGQIIRTSGNAIGRRRQTLRLSASTSELLSIHAHFLIPPAPSAHEAAVTLARLTFDDVGMKIMNNNFIPEDPALVSADQVLWSVGLSGDSCKLDMAAFEKMLPSLRFLIEREHATARENVRLRRLERNTSSPGVVPSSSTISPNTGAPAGWAGRCGGQLVCWTDFSRVRHQDREYLLTPKQACVIRHMVEGWENGITSFTNLELLASLEEETDAEYVRDLFRSNGRPCAVWNKVIGPLTGPGSRGKFTLMLAAP